MAISSTYTFAGATSPIVGTNYNHFKSVTTAQTINATGVVLSDPYHTLATATSGNSFYSGYESGWTFEIKFKATALAGQRLFTVDNSTSNNSFVSIESVNAVIHYTAGGGSSQASVPSGFFITDNTFYTYKFVYNGSQISFFRNGTQIGTGTNISAPRTDYKVNRVWILGSPAGLSGATAANPITVEYATFSLGSQNFQKITRTVSYVGFTNQTDATFVDACVAIPADLIAANQQWDILIGPSSATNNEWVLSNIANAITFNQVVNGDVTRFVRVAAVPGRSFKDHPNKSNNALRYNTANGIAIKNTAGYCVSLRPYCIVENLQLSGGAFFYGVVETSTFGGTYGPGDAIIRNCILESYNGYYMFKHGAGYAASTLVNCLLYMITPNETGGIGGNVLAGGDWNSNYYNCTFIIQNPRRAMFGVGANYGTNAMKNCVFINVLPVSGFQLSFSGNASNNFSTDSFSGYGVTATKISGEKQFQDLYGNGLLDARVRQGSDLIGAGIRLQSLTNDEDILGNARSTTAPTIGCHEFSTTYYTRKATNLIVGKLGNFLTQRWRQQPQGAVEIDWNNPIVQAIGLDTAWSATNPTMRFSVRGGLQTNSVNSFDGLSVRSGANNLKSARGVVLTAANNPDIDLGAMPSMTEFTYIAVLSQGATVNSFPFSSRTGTNSPGFELLSGEAVGAGNASLRIGTSTTLLSGTNILGGFNDSFTHTYFGTWKTSEAPRLYVDRPTNTVSGSATTGTINSSQNLKIGNRGGTRWTGFVGLVLVGTKQNINAGLELLNNPWQIFKPKPSKIYSFGYNYLENTRPRTNLITTQTNVVAASNIDCSLGMYFTKTVSANTTFTVSNVPSGCVYKLVLRLTVTSGTITWWSGVNWPETNAPYLTPNRSHLLIFQTTNGGTTWQGSYSLDYIDNSDPILSSGLLLYLDVGKTNSYPGTGTTWTDISGNNINATLVNAPTFNTNSGGYLNFTSASASHATAANLGNLTNWTVEAVVRFTASYSGKIAAVICSEYNGVLNFSIGTNNAPTNYNIGVGFFHNNAWRTTAGIQYPLNTWIHITGTYDGSTVRQFTNGVQVDSLTYSGTPTSGGGVRINRRWDLEASSTHTLDSNIAITRVYNRALTQSEVTQNFNATRARFGI